MDKWEELRETIQELHENNKDKQDVELITRFLLNLMDVLDKEEPSIPFEKLVNPDKESIEKRDAFVNQKQECIACSVRYLCKDTNDCMKKKY